ncbi:cell division protein FtsQ [Thiosulfatimonas sediminis]|uniref:Cell division protein FtsQ n=1 Tax=Thiosulfatimonas sediminis TaxID=2675054 RepID=A0A6F8PWQ5_9GAMM|nr:cell division protein FtsQ/DivIB [Thiosulfatimonas sediminis]BBP46526.1 cell division protein FtsQ [Thiosulfatimonas sediminis]
MQNKTAELLAAEPASEESASEPSKLPKVAFWLLTFGLVVLMLAWVLLPNKPADNWFSKSVTEYSIVSSAGLNEVSPEDVDAILQDYMGASFWDVPIEVIQGRLNQLDWVVTSEVTRVWPNQLKIHIFEQQPLARWGEAGLINQEGRVFFPRSLSGYENYMVLDGELKNSRAILQRFQEIAPLFQEQGFMVIGLSQKNGDIWRIELANQQQLILKEVDWEAKLQQFFQAYPQLTEAVRKSAQTFDLRYSNGFVIAQKGD